MTLLHKSALYGYSSILTVGALDTFCKSRINSAHNAELWREIDAFTRELRAGETAESIKLQPAIAATREAYKRCGKDPSRYRPSAEALRRRLMRGLELYQIDTLVVISALRFLTPRITSIMRCISSSASGKSCS